MSEVDKAFALALALPATGLAFWLGAASAQNLTSCPLDEDLYHGYCLIDTPRTIATPSTAPADPVYPYACNDIRGQGCVPDPPAGGAGTSNNGSPNAGYGSSTSGAADAGGNADGATSSSSGDGSSSGY